MQRTKPALNAKTPSRATQAANTVKARPKKTTTKTQLLPSGSTLLNLALSDTADGGIPTGKVINVIGDSSAGKAQPLTALLLTPTGYVQMGDITVGDMVVGVEGTPTMVMGVYPQGPMPLYKITFSDKTTTECCGNHLWLVKTQNDIVRGTNGRILRTMDLHTGLVPRKFRIPLVQNPIEFTAAHVVLDAYLLGILIGDGSYRAATGQIRISLWESDVRQKVVGILNSMGYDLIRINSTHDYRVIVMGCPDGRTSSGAMLPFKQILMDLSLYDKKSTQRHVPTTYLFNSQSVRLSLLQGLFDSDGYIGVNGDCIFACSSEQLAIDFCFLVRSFGGVATMTTKNTKYKKHGIHIPCHTSFPIYFRLPEHVPFCTSKKHNARRIQKSRGMVRSIISIEYIGIADCQCIKVAALDGLYLTNDMIVTHNTMVAETMLAEISHDPKYGHYELILDDAEEAMEMDIAGLFGKKAADRIKAPRYTVDGMPVHSKTVEDFYAKILQLIKDGKPFVYCLDSLDALTDTSETEQAEELRKAAAKLDLKDDTEELKMPGSYGMGKAKLMSQVFRNITSGLAATDSVVLVISQTRANVNARPGQPTKKRAGGDALQFYCSHVVWLAAIKTHKAGKEKFEEIIGREVEAKITKNKLTGKVRAVHFAIFYDYGIDDIGSCIDFLCKYGVLQKKGGRIDATALGYAEKTMYERDLIALIEDEDRMEDLKALVAQAWQDKEAAVSLDYRKPRFA